MVFPWFSYGLLPEGNSRVEAPLTVRRRPKTRRITSFHSSKKSAVGQPSCKANRPRSSRKNTSKNGSELDSKSESPKWIQNSSISDWKIFPEFSGVYQKILQFQGFPEFSTAFLQTRKSPLHRTKRRLRSRTVSCGSSTSDCREPSSLAISTVTMAQGFWSCLVKKTYCNAWR